MNKYKGLKILFFNKYIPDYLYDLIYAGLKELECIVQDYPEKPSLHSHINGCPPQLKFNFKKEEITGQPDLMIVCAHGYNNNDSEIYYWCLQVAEAYNKFNPKEVIIIDGSDHSSCKYPALDKDYKAIFKRELTEIPYPNWYPISFCSREEDFIYKPYSQRGHDVSFIASSPSNPLRSVIANHLKYTCENLNLKAFIYVEEGQIDRPTYLRILADSKTSVSVKGLGWDCYRYWEIAAKGILLISDISPILIHKDFNDALKFDNLNSLETILKFVKDTPDEILESLALKLLMHTKEHHTPKKRAQYILDKII